MLRYAHSCGRNIAPMRFQAILLLTACCWAACSQSPVPQPRHPAGSGTPASGVAPVLKRLQSLSSGDALNADQTAQAVKLGAEVVKELSGNNRGQQPPARLASATLDALARLAQLAQSPVHRGQLLASRSKLLQQLGRVEAAREEAEAAAALLHGVMTAWEAPEQAGSTAAAADAASTDTEGAASTAGAASRPDARRQAASTALSTLLDLCHVLRQLGLEERINELLAAAVVAAPRLHSVGGYLRSVAQLSKLSDGQLEGVLACMAAVEGGQVPAAAGCSWLRAGTADDLNHGEDRDGGTGKDGETGKDRGNDEDQEGEKGEENVEGRRQENGEGRHRGKKKKPIPDLQRLYYGAFRGLHARKRYAEAWRALGKAKLLHVQGRNFTRKDYAVQIAAMERLFPPVNAAAAAAESSTATAAPPGAGPGLAGTAMLHVQKAAASGSAWLQHQLSILAAWLLPSTGKGQVTDATAAADAEPEAEAAAGDEPSSDGSSGGGRREMRPIFVLGLPRSGSTLIEQILASHPDVWGAGEHTTFKPVASKLQRMLEANGSSGVDAAALQQLRRRYLTSMRAKVPAERQLSASWLVDKALANAWLVGHIALLMPEACVVHAVRHPADTALSAYQQSFFPHKVPWSFNLTHIAGNVAAHHRIMQHWDRALPGRVLHLHYAHMVADQEGSTRRLIEHCGLPWHPALLRFYETERSVQTASQLQVKRPIYKTSLNNWHAYKEGLAPLLLELRDVILRYEEHAGLPSSQEVLDQLAAAAAAQRQQQAAGDEGPEEQQREGEEKLATEQQEAEGSQVAQPGTELLSGTAAEAASDVAGEVQAGAEEAVEAAAAVAAQGRGLSRDEL